ncbi:hypothetical protein TRFO_40177 [Tritrichomonas foetus]|uniref:Uncharacterized protein n=1 Tax=Tritrichomonas foetus TaxID=1144522 RepID=A0A1J4J5Y8_9EUKA|nr:hypothetical protein TRFO_40177 [Tritrichomonas foetus]|eukprot:OHS93567.1 hypothetical protein TRFO_40177 [Tritrichomonas foetus]
MIAADRYGVSFLLKQCPNDRLVNPISINNVLDDPVIKAHYFLQDKFYKISENNIEQITQFIIDNNLISQENVFDLIKNFFNCIVGRTQLIPYFIQLIKNLNQFCNFYEEIKTHLHFFIKGFGQNPLINELKSHNIITDNDIEQSTTLESKDT